MTLLAATGIRKTYAAPALDGVDFELWAGEVHALVGENGAGKSTLAKVLCGVVAPDAGSMALNGSQYRPTDKLDAERHGVRMVMQELNLIGTLTVAENIFLAHMPRRLGFVRAREMNAAGAALLSSLGLDIPPDRLVSSLGVGQQQLVEIAAGLSQRCEVLILDEPTAALSDSETELLFRQIARLKASGVGVVYISHRLEEVRRIADRITVLRDGRVVGELPPVVAVDEIVRLMVGRELGASAGVSRSAGEVALRVEGLCCGPVRDVSFEVRRGEVLGFAGLMGSGRTGLMRAVFGADIPSAGTIYRPSHHVGVVGDSPSSHSEPISHHVGVVGADERVAPVCIRSPRDAVRNGIALLTEDRKELGLLLPLSVRANVTLTKLNSVARFGWVNGRAERKAADALVSRLAVRLASAEQPAAELSGGNQQKVVIAKWLFRDCDVLIFDEPTRGIDVAAKFEIYRLLSELASRGKAIVVVSSDLKELLALCDRIVVMSAGRLVRTFQRDEFDQDAIMSAALSGYVGGVARGK